jgi:hypothetical protein
MRKLIGLALIALGCGTDAPNVANYAGGESNDPQYSGSDPDADPTQTSFDAGPLVTRTQNFPLHLVVGSREFTTTDQDVIAAAYGRQVFRAIVSYSFVYAADKQTLDLNPVADPRTIRIVVGGQDIPANRWQATATELIITNPPALGANVSLTYRRGDALPTRINVATIPSQYLSYKVYANDLLQTGANLDPAGSNVNFSEAPLDEAIVRVDFVTAKTPVLRYAHNLGALAQENTCVAHYADDVRPLNIALSGDYITLDQAAFSAGRTVKVYALDTSTVRETIDISEYVEPGSLVVENLRDFCVAGDIIIDGAHIDLSGCESLRPNSFVTVSYRTIR